MGRELKRVPMDFAWPINKVWDGYLNPHYKPCPAEEKGLCKAGWSAAGKWLHAIARHITMLGEHAAEEPRKGEIEARGRLWPHPYLVESAFSPRTDIPHEVLTKLRDIDDERERRRSFDRYFRENPPQLLPFTEELLELVVGLAGRRPRLPIDTNLTYEIENALKKAAGLDENWGVCKVCEGHSIDPSVRAARDAWEPTEPPTGDGFQLWETTSEGSPVSTVFATLDALCAWCAENATTFGSAKASAEQWRNMLDAGLVHHTEGNVPFI